MDMFHKKQSSTYMLLSSFQFDACLKGAWSHAKTYVTSVVDGNSQYPLYVLDAQVASKSLVDQDGQEGGESDNSRRNEYDFDPRNGDCFANLPNYLNLHPQ